MTQQLKTILLKCAIVIMAVSIIGIPSFYHHCLLRGNHNWQTGFIADSRENHCICCEDVEDECSHVCTKTASSCCENVQHHQNETLITHANCCNIEVVSLQVTATAYFPKQYIKQLFNSRHCGHDPQQSFSYPVIQLFSHSAIQLFNYSIIHNYSSYHGFSPPRAVIFLFTQFLL